jgi:hypothetical protein
MRKGLFAATLLVVFVAGYVLAAQPWGSPAAAQEDRIVPVFINDFRTGWSLTAEGEPCTLVGGISGRSAQIPIHVVVKDETGTIIASAEPDGVASWGGFEDYYNCQAIFDLPVPDAEFYTLHVGDRYIRTVSAADFPLGFGIVLDMENGT